MDWNNIERLLERYYEGESTIAEETELREAMLHKDCPPYLKSESHLFSFLAAESNIQAENLTYQLSVSKPTNKLVSIAKKYSGMAAALALLAIFYFTQSQTCADNQPVLAVINNQKICDETIAKQQAKEALQLVASKLNKGTSKLDYIHTINTPIQISKQ